MRFLPTVWDSPLHQLFWCKELQDQSHTNLMEVITNPESYKAMKGISLVNLVEHMASDYRLTNGRVKTILTLATIPFP